MKKILPIIALFMLLSACQDEVKFNDPGFQAFRDDVLFRAIQVTAFKSSTGAVRIEALAQDEEFVLNISNSTVGTYYMASTNVNNWATYTSSFDDVVIDYSTRQSFEPITTIANAILTGGTGYTSSNAVATTNTGNGSGMVVKTTAVDGVITSVKIVNAGVKYKSGDIITINGGDGNAKFRVLSEVKITKSEDGMISGEFRLNLQNIYDNPAGQELVNFQNGAFYNIPLVQE
ncbi:MAG: hypothetical protein JNJ52_04390 [Flavobacterium sp.]|nr:hypothetical protein [Flavobacterium sp.]